MWGLMTPAYLMLGAIAAILSIPLLVGAIAVITWVGNAIGLGA